MRWLGFVCGAALTLAGSAAQADPKDWPLPPPRPPDVSGAPEAAPAPAPPQKPPEPAPPPAASSPPPAASCLAELAADHIEVEPADPPPAPLDGCAIETPVRLRSVTLASGAALVFPARPLLDCRFAATFAGFVREVAAPLAAASLGSPVAALETGPGYECRGRDRVAGAKVSEHGKGSAIDVAAFVLADKRRIAVARQADDREAAYVRTVRTAACGWFTTVLGPGSDPFHADHLHLDTLQHGSSDRYRICE